VLELTKAIIKLKLFKRFHQFIVGDRKKNQPDNIKVIETVSLVGFDNNEN